MRRRQIARSCILYTCIGRSRLTHRAVVFIQYTCTQTRQPKTYFIRSIPFATSKCRGPTHGIVYMDQRIECESYVVCVCVCKRSATKPIDDEQMKWNQILQMWTIYSASGRLESNSLWIIFTTIDAQNIDKHLTNRLYSLLCEIACQTFHFPYALAGRRLEQKKKIFYFTFRLYDRSLRRNSLFSCLRVQVLAENRYW